ncbi:hypothetical protein G6O69_36920 [Pseudenhygromyxa sp. WMMC2535]|nr:hypothetical protein [Pseudenhygromyxa sp. WMMC2535]NVB43464.1 hypothetical protein [Pseudenhygromyxa sp. WMMC2535]
MVFVDRTTGYTPAVGAVGSLTAAGRDYYLVPVDWGARAFHPKVHLFCHRNVALVGSGNLTPSGMGRNLEAFDRLDGQAESAALDQVREFFRALIKHELASLPQRERTHLLARVPATNGGKGDASFLHSLGTRVSTSNSRASTWVAMATKVYLRLRFRTTTTRPTAS